MNSAGTELAIGDTAPGSCLLDIRHLSVCYPTPSGPLRAIRDVSFHILAGETLALVGETGCGKSTVALALLGLLESGQVESGEIIFEGRNLREFQGRDWRSLRGSRIGMVFQDARSALNPVLTIGDHLVETIRTHQQISRKAALTLAADLLRETGIPEPRFQMRRYPTELSGGMCQRVGIALGICNRPKLLVADEPTSALDPTIQAQIMALLGEMKRRHGLSLLLISHDLTLVSESAERVAVMYQGRMVESGPGSCVLARPAHPYTRGLTESVPNLSHNCATRPLAGVPDASPARPEEFTGCPFVPRCQFSEARCSAAFPEPVALADDHWAACYSTEIRGRPTPSLH